MPDPIDKTIEDNETFSKGGVETAIKYIQRDIAQINEKLDNKYVTKEEFDPIKKIVYGMVALILTAFLTGLISLVIINAHK